MCFVCPVFIANVYAISLVFFPLFSAFFLFSLKLCIKVGGVWGGGPNNFGFLGDISNFKLKLHYFVST